MPYQQTAGPRSRECVGQYRTWRRAGPDLASGDVGGEAMSVPYVSTGHCVAREAASAMSVPDMA
eukprot:1847475-Rhodomonas_salina.5